MTRDADRSDAQPDDGTTSGKLHPFAPDASENVDGRETPFVRCHTSHETDRPEFDTERLAPPAALLLPVGVALAAVQTPFAVSLLGLVFVVVGGVAFSQTASDASV